MNSPATLDHNVDKQSLRFKILEAAAQLFHEKGYQATSIDDIAEAGGIARRSIYHHFKSKKEILTVACLEQARLFLIEVQQQVPKTNDFPTYVADCLYYVVTEAPNSKLFVMDVSKGSSLDPVALYFGNVALIEDWIRFFQEPYVEALRSKVLNPEVKLNKLVNWFGRLATSFLQYKLDGETNQDIRESIDVLFKSALEAK
ncbi:MAG: TetR/AcrR family transcriptional regulator [Pseudomonadales bacterium]|nr:TetR/AcrR family transcriptional regulator [Pseudomonadales bacterium]